jgi:diketogulonate reductase-like aldo/keto reductase
VFTNFLCHFCFCAVYQFLVSDTAAVYRNEEAIGLALKTLLPKFNLSREDIFLTTKLGN